MIGCSEVERRTGNLYVEEEMIGDKRPPEGHQERCETADHSEYFNTAEAAQKLSLSIRTMEKLRVEGRGPAFFKFGRLVFYTEHTLRQWTASRIRRSTSDRGV
jgi:hypothetical protein